MINLDILLVSVDYKRKTYLPIRSASPSLIISDVVVLGIDTLTPSDFNWKSRPIYTNCKLYLADVIAPRRISECRDNAGAGVGVVIFICRLQLSH